MQGHHKEAEWLGVQVLEVMKKVLGEEHPVTRLLSVGILRIHLACRTHKEAEELEFEC